MKKFFIFCLCILAFIPFCKVAGEAYQNHPPHIIPIAMASDNNYIYPTMIAMTSILENKNQDTEIKFYVMISENVNSENKEKMKRLESMYSKTTVNLISMNDKYNNSYIDGTRITTPTYYRLSLASLLPQHDKVLYLDGDIIVRKDLWNMYNTDISDFYIGGVKDIGKIVCQLGEDVTYAQRMGINDINQYVNAGVLSLNLRKMREDNMEEKFNNFIPTLKQRRLYLNDQDVLNATCYNKIKFLSPEYNAMQHFWLSYEYMPILVDSYNPQELKRACWDPTIVHYSSHIKPWNETRLRFYPEWNRYREIVERNFYERPISDGVYQMLSAVAENKAVDINAASKDDYANVQIWNSNYTDAQKFKLSYVGEGCYEAEALCSGKVLDVLANGMNQGTNVIQYTRNRGNNQRWLLKKANDNYFFVVSKSNGLCLDVSEGLSRNGANVQVWPLNYTNAQKFKFIPVC